MVALYKDPEGETIFCKSEVEASYVETGTGSSSANSNESVDILKRRIAQPEEQQNQQEGFRERVKTLEMQLTARNKVMYTRHNYDYV